MPGFDGTGPNGMGPMTGGGRGFCNPWGVQFNPRGYGAFGRGPYAYPFYGTYGNRSYTPRMSREQELEYLKNEAQALREDLKEIEAGIEKLSAGKE